MKKELLSKWVSMLKLKRLDQIIRLITTISMVFTQLQDLIAFSKETISPLTTMLLIKRSRKNKRTFSFDIIT